MNLHLTEARGLHSGLNPELQTLFHRLNNQLGIILAHAELLESKADNDIERARAAQVVTSVLDALGTTRQIRQHWELTDAGV